MVGEKTMTEDLIQHFLSLEDKDHPYSKDLEAFETVKQFLIRSYEIAFGDDAINRRFTSTDVLDQLQELSDNFAENDR